MLSLLVFIGITALVVFAVTYSPSKPNTKYRKESSNIPPAKEKWDKKEYY